jgi:hypothetical protein
VVLLHGFGDAVTSLTGHAEVLYERLYCAVRRLQKAPAVRLGHRITGLDRPQPHQRRQSIPV